MQAQIWCTANRATKVTVSLTLIALIATTVNWTCFLHDVVVVNDIYDVFNAVLVVAVLILNVMVVHQVRRSATNAAANLGVQQHHQSTSSNSVVPTAMLIATSISYALLYGSASILQMLYYGKLFEPLAHFSYDTRVVGRKVTIVVLALSCLVFVYNFFIYLITGRRFRSELRKLFSCCLSSPAAASSSSAATVTVTAANDTEVAKLRDQNDTTV